MRGRFLAFVLAVVAVGCSQPRSREFFQMRENAEYGDTYSFSLDLCDSTVTYSMDFFTKLERAAFERFSSEDIILDLRWFSPSDSIITDTVRVLSSLPAGGDYYTRDLITPYEGVRGLTPGEWRLKAKVVNSPEAVRGVGIILRREDGTR